MSAITEAANREAERAEQEHPDEEEAEAEEAEQPAPEPEPEPEQPAEPDSQGLTQAEGDKITDQAAAAGTRYLNAQIKRLEPLGLPLQPCPLCIWPGVAMPRQAHEVTSDVESAVLALIGKGQAPELREAVDAEACPDCDGWGDVLTGAKKDIAATKPCTRCGGKGWIQKVAAIDVRQPNGAPAYPGAELQYTPLPQGIPDAWQRPAGHPHWGRDPREIGA